MTRPCPTCDGEGVIKSEETLAIEFERRMRDLVKETDAEAILLQMNPRVSAEFTRDDARVLRQIEEETGKWFTFEGSEGLPLDHFAVVLESTREQVLERAVPFRAGEEVHVEIVEPHMYSPGDAVAKIDGYMISITGAGDYVGEKHLVRIEEAGRTSAVATLVDVPASPAPEDSADGEWTGRWPRIEASASWSQRRTAPFRRQGRVCEFIRMSAYAIVKTGGKQYRVEQGQTLLGGAAVVGRRRDRGAPAAAVRRRVERGRRRGSGAVSVEARVVAHERGPKLRVVKFKPKRGYKRRTGHRQNLTRIEITEVKHGT